MTRNDYGLLAAAALSFAVGLSGCGGGGSDVSDMMTDGVEEPMEAMIEPARPDPARVGTIMGAETVTEFLALGARRLSGAEFQAELVGKTLDEVRGSWTWNIRNNQMAASRADNDSWSSTSMWEIRNDQYCRGTLATDNCSTIYELDGVYRFGDAPDEGDELSGWAVVIQKDLVVDDAEAIAVGVDRDLVSPSTVMLVLSNASVNAGEDGGFTISFTSAGSAEQTFELAESDLGSNPNFASVFARRDGAYALYFWSQTGSFLEEHRDYSYFDLGGWAIVEYENANSSDFVSERLGNVVYGYRTPVDAIPAGNATFSGQVAATEYAGDEAQFTNDPSIINYNGDIELTASFDDMTLEGLISGLESSPEAEVGSWSDANGGMTFNAVIDGSGFSAADLAGTGDLAGYANGLVSGVFYGPAAEEAGGIFEASDGGRNRLLIGSFGAEQPHIE